MFWKTDDCFYVSSHNSKEGLVLNDLNKRAECQKRRETSSESRLRVRKINFCDLILLNLLLSSRQAMS